MSMEVTSNYNTGAANIDYEAKSAAQGQQAAATTAAEQPAAVYEKSEAKPADSTKQIYSKEDRAAIIKKLKADAAERQEQLVQLVADTLNGQKLKSSIASLFGAGDSKGIGLKDIFESMQVDEETIAQAQKDIAEDGYWGVEQTSDRMVEMAVALSGGDTSKADLLIESVKKGFEQATSAWGDELPEISQKTLDATLEKLNKWKEGTLNAENPVQ